MSEWQAIKNKTGIDQYAIKNDDFTICKVSVNNIISFELWHKEEFINRFNSSDEAKRAFENL